MARLKHQRMGKRKLATDDIITWGLRLLFIAAVIFAFWSQNNLILTKNFVFTSPELPKTFTGYRIVHISDICNSHLSLTAKVRKCNPNVIVISGGYYDEHGGCENSIRTINELSEIAPVYYVYGPNDPEDGIEGCAGINITNDVVELQALQLNAQDFIKEMYGNKILSLAEEGDEQAQQYVQYITEVLAEQSDATVSLIGLNRNDGENGKEEALEQAYDLLLKSKSEYTMGLVGSAWTIPEVSKSRLRLAFTGGTFGTKNISEIYTKGSYGIKSVQVFFSGGIGTYLSDKDGTKIRRIFNFPEIQCITLSDGTIANKNPLEKFIAMFWDDVGTVFDNDGGFKVHTFKGDELKNK